MAQVTTQLNKFRMAPRKVRAVVNLVKGKNVNDALAQLEYVIKRPSNSIIKVINSAVANAENNFNMVKDNLVIKDFIVNEGIKLRRFRPKGFGRASMIQKKISHVKITLEEKVPGLKRQESVQPKRTEKVYVDKEEQQKQADTKKPEIKSELGKKSGVIGKIGKRLFQRKAI